MLTTSKLAQSLHIKPESVIRRLCTTGSYFGLIPQKLANGRLLWPENSLDLLNKGGMQ